MNKDVTVEELREAIKRCEDESGMPYTYVMFGEDNWNKLIEEFKQ